MANWLQVATTRFGIRAVDVTDDLWTNPESDWASWYYTPGERLVQADYDPESDHSRTVLKVQVEDGDNLTTCWVDVHVELLAVELRGVIEGASNGPPATDQLSKVVRPGRGGRRFIAPTVIDCTADTDEDDAEAATDGATDTNLSTPPLTILVEATGRDYTYYLEFSYRPYQLTLSYAHAEDNNDSVFYRLTARGYCRIDSSYPDLEVLTPNGQTHRLQQAASPNDQYSVNQYGFLHSRRVSLAPGPQGLGVQYYVNWTSGFEVVPLTNGVEYTFCDRYLIHLDPPTGSTPHPSVVTHQSVVVRDITTGQQFSIATRVPLRRPLAFDAQHHVVLFSDEAGVLLLPINTQLPAYHITPALTPDVVPVATVDSLLDRYLDVLNSLGADTAEIRDRRQLGTPARDLLQIILNDYFPEPNPRYQWIAERSMIIAWLLAGENYETLAYQISFEQ